MSKTQFKGKPVKLAGDFVMVGAKAPHFVLVKGDLTPFTLEDVKGKWAILNIFPSLDTSVCASSVRKFNEMAASLPGVNELCVSRDLPFAQRRFCAAEGISHVVSLSDFRTLSTFGKDYVVLMVDGPLNGLFARAVVVINPEGKIVYTELVHEVTEEPHYDAALAAIKM